MMKRWWLMSVMVLMGVWLSGQTAVAQTDEPRQPAGDKTFVLRNGVWIDDAYEPAGHPIYRVGLRSAEFALLAYSVPTVDDYLRLGEHILFVYDGWAIELRPGTTAGPLAELVNQPLPRFVSSAVPIGEPLPPGQPTLIAVGSQPTWTIDWQSVGITAVFLLILGLIGLALFDQQSPAG